MSATVGLVKLDFALYLNPVRKTSYDYFKGSYAYYWNEVMKFLKLNLTISLASDYGNCYANGTCTGVVGMLSKGEVDFSLTPVAPSLSPDFPVTSTSPFTRGPVNGLIFITIQSLPRVQKIEKRLDMLQVYRDLPLSVLLFSFIFLLSIWLLCRIPLPKLGKRFRLKRRKYKLHLFAFADAFFNSTSLPLPSLGHLLCIYLSLICFITVLKNALSSSINSDVIKVEPAKYYETLKEFVSAAEKGKITIHYGQGLRAITELSMRRESIYRRTVRVSKSEPPTGVLTVVGRMFDGLGVFLGSHINTEWIKAYLCFSKRQQAQLLKLMDPPISESICVLGLKNNITRSLKNLLTKAYSILFESGMSKDYERKCNIWMVLNVLGWSQYFPLMNCYGNMEAVKSQTSELESKSNILTYDKAKVIFQLLASIFFCALLVNLLESVLYFGSASSGRKISRQPPNFNPTEANVTKRRKRRARFSAEFYC